ncbi:HAD-IIIA family hydrolase [Paraburkholderia steynii]|uniref:3-deoxy-D-manno-octulosonate 8-phosphate phosphatase KdsC n=1 Tax=Paraburkholderia steynii TaxID=1245441 RepID=A0A7Z7BDV0_9BURK|nr:HAD-IIIA family hydrolase [Paraburkholderia steynii]BEU28327.1 HAD-IIIA family hydrolase [Paraburkholderia sp. 22B1P]SDI93451.1 3-deoxy-D-manno-octulosonate 8-phosphate phosphatase (KDO 8-P phosphatase) [Paraburkholderia steynii]
MSPQYRGAIRLVLFDVDGVLTDGSIYLDGEGECMKQFNVKDGIAVALLRSHGIATGILSAKSSPALTLRASQLKFDVVVTGCDRKLVAYEQIKIERGLQDTQIAFVGDDVIDLAVMRVAGYACAPADAHPLVLRAAAYVAQCSGGHGVARDVAEHLLVKGGLSRDAAYAPLIESWSRHDVTQ